MQDTNVLKRGLSIVSRCKKETKDIWHAHFGVAAIASYFFSKENNLALDTVNQISSQTTAMLNKHALGETIDVMHGVDFQKAEDMILTALEKNINGLHWVGHNVIYTALSLLAIRELHNWGTQEDIEGIADLILSFEKTIPGRSWIGFSTSEVKRLQINNNDTISSINNPEKLSEFILKELSQFKVIYKAEAHHDLIGHMLTFSHALNILHDLGHVSFFKKGLVSLLKLVQVLRESQNLKLDEPIKLNSPVDCLPLVRKKQATALPTEELFWLKDHSHSDWDFGHQFKFSLSYFNHLQRASGYKDSTMENFRYIISF
ncbi:hypothetical protein [Bacillus gaemokensis]|uniref:Uncharacterized protein n=1 Tax=Bacillus gaemokensis TaxID=574375 RepID=A0A073KMC1_9BACI|nr:hypothetical protein [Bacillus gaemokensis]KEK23478.1 hypothetical protein BAGA_08245 [Bacillus gaemokensis]KYG27153.1 hypothetical protein AZF08_15470 [Bacillus gaemokensis]